MNVVIWVQYDTFATQNKAKGKSLLGAAIAALDKPKGTVNIVGVVESIPVPINKLDNIIDKKDLAKVDCDLILVTGHNVDLAPILVEAEQLGVDPNKFVLDRTVLTPGFTLEKHKEESRRSNSLIKNVVIWVQYDTIAAPSKTKGQSLLRAAITALDKPKGSVNIVGVVESVPMPINRLPNLIDKKDLANIDCDLILVTGHDVDLAPILKEAATLGVDTDKFVLDRTILMPGFTLEKYRELRKSDLSIISMGWWAGIAYHKFGLPELSPTVGMYTSEEHFMNFLPEARWHLKKDLRFERTEYNYDLGINYPIFWLDGTQWFMNGYTNDADALELWNERRDKINWSNVLVTMHTSSPAVLERFDCLPYPKKVCFVPFETELKSGFYVAPQFFNGNLLQASEGIAAGEVGAYDIWDLLLYGKKTPLK